MTCACGAPERCWPDSDTCAFHDTGYPWCHVCKEHHRAPDCTQALLLTTDDPA